MSSPLLQLEQVSCSHDKQTVVNKVSFDIKAGEIACLLGPSGSGKTTLLNAIAGLHEVDDGQIKLRESQVSDAKHTLAPEKRDLAMVFQDLALLPHKTAFENIYFAVDNKRSKRGEKLNKKAKLAAAENALKLAELEAFRDRYPHELSGGQQQRVAFARALAPNPDLILFDEPFSSLDKELRDRLASQLRKLLKSTHTAAIIVTHDQQEAFAIADNVGIVKDGKLQQWDAPWNVYHHPKTEFIAEFIGKGCWLQGQLNNNTISTTLGDFDCCEQHNLTQNQPVRFRFRPDQIIPQSSGNLSAKLVELAFHGEDALYTLRFNEGTELLCSYPSHTAHSVGETINLSVINRPVMPFAVS